MKSYLRSTRGRLICAGDLAFFIALASSQVGLAFVLGGAMALITAIASIFDKGFCEHGDDLRMLGISCFVLGVGFVLIFFVNGTEAGILLSLTAAMFWLARFAVIRLLHYTRKYGAF